MTLPIFQIDAFSSKVFGGNPAAVIPLEEWLADDVLQKIALENNLSETVFLCKEKSSEKFEIRWFTPKVEVDLCGHATVASAYYLFEISGYSKTITFSSKSGDLSVSKEDGWYYLDFPYMELTNENIPDQLAEGVGGKPISAHKSKDDWQLVYETEQEILDLQPNFSLLKDYPARGIIATAPSSQTGVDFVSRFFAPASGIDEDPVTGSAHTKLIPYWAKILQKDSFVAKQLSHRGGYLKCKLQNDRVLIGGEAVLYLIGNIYI